MAANSVPVSWALLLPVAVYKVVDSKEWPSVFEMPITVWTDRQHKHSKHQHQRYRLPKT